MEETVMKFWLLYVFEAVLILLSWQDIPLLLLGLPEATRRLGTDEEGCVRVEQWSATRIFASASELWHTSEASIRLAGSVPWHVLTRFAILMSSWNSLYIYMILPEECCRFLCDMDYVWTYYIPLYDVDILIVCIYIYICLLDTFIMSSPLSHASWGLQLPRNLANVWSKC